MDARARQHDPYVDFHFIVDFDFEGMKAGFSEVHGLPTEADIEYLARGEGTKVRKLPGVRKYTNLVFKRGFTTNNNSWEWFNSVTDGKTRRLSGTIAVFDEVGQVASSWKFDEGWPLKWNGPPLNSKDNEVQIEELGIVVEGLKQTQPDDDPKP